MSPKVAAGQPREFVEVLVFQLSLVCHMQLRIGDVAFLVQCLGSTLNIPNCVALGIFLLDLVLSLRSSNPGRRSVCCIGSKVTLLCGMVSFTTGLTGWMNRSKSSLFLTVCIVCVGIVGNFFVVGVIFVWPPPLLLLLLSAVLVFFRAWFSCRLSWRHWFRYIPGFLQWWQVDLGFSEFCCMACCVTVFIWGFQTIQSHFRFKMWHNLFICAILQMHPVDWFPQVGRHLGIYELLNDILSGNSECIFH